MHGKGQLQMADGSVAVRTPTKLTNNRLDEFLNELPERVEGVWGSAGNQKLRQRLGWEEEFDWRVQGRLVEERRIAAGRGKGGSVRFTQGQAVASDAPEDGTPLATPDDPASSRSKASRISSLARTCRRGLSRRYCRRFAGIGQSRAQGQIKQGAIVADLEAQDPRRGQGRGHSDGASAPSSPTRSSSAIGAGVCSSPKHQAMAKDASTTRLTAALHRSDP